MNGKLPHVHYTVHKFFCSYCPFDPFYLSSQNKNEDVHTCLVWNSNLELILNRGNKKILMDRSYLN